MLTGYERQTRFSFNILLHLKAKTALSLETFPEFKMSPKCVPLRRGFAPHSAGLGMEGEGMGRRERGRKVWGVGEVIRRGGGALSHCWV